LVLFFDNTPHQPTKVLTKGEDLSESASLHLTETYNIL